jgi:hypothetical protein
LYVPEILHAVKSAGLPASIAVGAYYGARTLAMLTSMYGSKKLSKRALKVLKVVRRGRGSR